MNQNQGDCKGLQNLARGLAIAVAALLLAALIGIFLLGRASAVEGSPTPAQIAACTPDALRLCAAAIPNPAAVKTCMLRHRAQLSQACREAFAR